MRKMREGQKAALWSFALLLKTIFVFPALTLLGAAVGTNYPNGLRSYGVPVLGGGGGLPVTKGNIYHVDSGHTDAVDTNAGDDPNYPLATIDAAIGKCTADNGDIILVSEGHAENITTATGINFDVAGVTLVGLGSGAAMPTVSFTALGGSITIGAASVMIKNIRLVANVTGGVTVGITIAAAGDQCTLDGVVMRDTSTTKEFLKHITVATTVLELTIQNCSLVGTAGSMLNSIFFEGSTEDLLLRNNLIHVDSSDSVVDHLTTAAVRALVLDNIIVNEDTGAAKYCLEFKTASTGAAARNMMGYNKIDAEMGLGDAMFWFENYASNTIAQSGLLDPTTAHAIP
ncbi:hypothetical protein CMI37_14445 [Candidatus Pacearchaeota archaeon]|nr:hypothetical protein [Candidatus Pacearchaeota archaeon]